MVSVSLEAVNCCDEAYLFFDSDSRFQFFKMISSASENDNCKERIDVDIKVTRYFSLSIEL